MKSRENEKSVRAGQSLSSKTADVTGAVQDFSEALRPEARFSNHVLKVGTEKYFLAQDRVLNELEDLCELKAGCAMSAKVSMVPVGSPRALSVRGVRPFLLSMCPIRTTLRTL